MELTSFRRLLPAVALFSLLLATSAGKHTCPDPDYFPPFPNYFYWLCQNIYSRDHNKDKKVTKSEYLSSVVINNMTPERAMAYFLTDELNGDGVIDSKDDPIYFDRMDANNDGRVTYQEDNTFEHNSFYDIVFMLLHQRVAKKFNVTSLDKSQFRQLFTSVTPTGSGNISKDEFWTAWWNKLGGLTSGRPGAFKHLDTNGDNQITEQELEEHFPSVDANNNGKIEYWEVYRIDGRF